MRHFARRKDLLEEQPLLSRFKICAYTYMCSKSIIVLTTFFVGKCFLCQNPIKFLLHSIIHILLFGHFIYIGLLLVYKILAVTSILKGIIYLINFFTPITYSFYIPFINMPVLLGDYADTGNVFMIINALLCFIVSILLLTTLTTVAYYPTRGQNRQGNKAGVT